MSESKGVMNLPDSIAGDAEHAQVRDLSPIVDRKYRYKRIAWISGTFALLSLLLIQMPSTIVSITTKMMVPMFFYISVGITALSIIAHRKWSKHNPSQNQKIVHPKPYKPKADEILIGYDMETGEPHTCSLKQLTEHFSVCGSSGSGKTTFNNTIVRQLLLRDCPVIYFNGKRSDANIARATYLAESADALSRLRVIDPLAEYGHHINPLASSRETGKLANKVLNLLPAASAEGGAAHYRQLTYRNIVQLIDVLLATNKIFNYEDILAFISHTAVSVDILKEELSSKGQREALMQLSTWFASMDTQKNQMYRQLREDMAGLEAQLQALVTLESGKFISSNEPTVTFKDSIQKNHFLFVQLPVLQDMEQSEKLANILFLELTEAIGDVFNSDGKSLLKPCVVIMEEVSSYAQSILSLLMMQAREAGFAFMPFLQVPNSLQKRERGLSAEFMEEVMGNCGRQYWLNINGKDGQKWASESFGKAVRYFASVGRSEMEGKSGELLGAKRFINPNVDTRIAKTASWTEQLDDIVHPAMFRDLNYWESFIYIDGGIRRIMLNHTFIAPPPDYDVSKKIPKLPFHGERSPLLLASRVNKRLQSQFSTIEASDMHSDQAVKEATKAAMNSMKGKKTPGAKGQKPSEDIDPWS